MIEAILVDKQGFVVSKLQIPEAREEIQITELVPHSADYVDDAEVETRQRCFQYQGLRGGAIQFALYEEK